MKGLTKPYVLYVEDDPIIHKAYAFFLKKILRLEVDTVTNGYEVLEKIKHNNYDLIILDGGLPDISGFEVGRRIRSHEKNKNGPRLPLLLLSAYPYEIVSEECKSAEIDSFRIKPISFQELKNLIFQWLPKNKSNLLGLHS